MTADDEETEQKSNTIIPESSMEYIITVPSYFTYVKLLTNPETVNILRVCYIHVCSFGCVRVCVRYWARLFITVFSPLFCLSASLSLSVSLCM